MPACVLTGADADEEVSSGDFRILDCAAAGGKYHITYAAEAEVAQLSPQEKARIVTWLIDERRQGRDEPKITSEKVAEAVRAKPIPIFERINRIYRFLQSSLRSIGDRIVINSSGPRGITAVINRQHLRALTESVNDADLNSLINYGVASNMLDLAHGELGLTINGWQHLEELDHVGRNSGQVFVAMWFDDSLHEAYENGIEPAIRSLGYLPLRIDKKEHNNKIDDEIIAEIRRSQFLVADFTCGNITEQDSGKSISLPRGGVYYEAGFAQGLGLQVIWTCRQDQIANVHFDTRQYNHIVWRDPADLRKKLAHRIGAVIGDGPFKT